MTPSGLIDSTRCAPGVIRDICGSTQFLGVTNISRGLETFRWRLLAETHSMMLDLYKPIEKEQVHNGNWEKWKISSNLLDWLVHDFLAELTISMATRLKLIGNFEGITNCATR